MFGLTSSAGVFGSVADMLIAIYGKAGFELIRKWVDDFLIVRLPHQLWSEAKFMAVTSVCVFAAGYRSAQAHLQPSAAVAADLPWIQLLLSHLPNRIPLATPSPLDVGWWGDASTSFRIGVVVQGHWAIWCWALGFKVRPSCAFDISWAEAVAIELGFQVALHLGIYIFCTPLV
ncbi:hypothetical protein EDB19DRAFT_1832862 [Suillus lakei]|nr:hypothetical protein EDB19DRAFT_1832862 [Suillus lakei]